MLENLPSNLFTNQLNKQYETFFQHFSSHVFFGKIFLYEIPKDVRPNRDSLLSEIVTCGNRIERYLGFDFKKAEEIAKKRDLFITKLFMHFQPVDLLQRGYKAKRNFALSRSREIL